MSVRCYESIAAADIFCECRLDEARAARFMHRQPKRIILIRHAESIGNVDSSVYAHVPDNKLDITERGRQQAYVSGVNVRELWRKN